MTETCFHIAWFVKAKFHQLIDPRLRGRTLYEVMNALHSGAISASEGRLATSTSRLVSATLVCSNDAILIESASTNPSSSESGGERFT